MFDPDLDLIATTDASQYGLSGLLGQTKEIQEVPISFATYTLSCAKRIHSVGEKKND